MDSMLALVIIGRSCRCPLRNIKADMNMWQARHTGMPHSSRLRRAPHVHRGAVDDRDSVKVATQCIVKRLPRIVKRPPRSAL